MASVRTSILRETSTPTRPPTRSTRYTLVREEPRWGAQVGKTLITNLTTPGEVADLLLGEVPYLAQKKSDPEYVVWYQALVSVCEGLEAQPWTSSDWVTPPGWGIGQKVVFPYPPAPKG